MKTNLTSKKNAILVCDEGEQIAIIGCEEGEGDVKAKLELAIREHYCIEDDAEVNFTSNDVLNDFDEASFTISYDDDGEDAVRDFTLQALATY